MRKRPSSIVSVVATVVLLSLTGVAVANSSWLAESEEPAGSAADQAADPVEAPEEDSEGRISRSVVDIVADIPDIKNLVNTGVVDFAENNVTWGVARFEDADGAAVEFVVQRLPGPISREAIGPADETTVDSGRHGEQVVVRDNERTLQVVVVSANGLMVNVIVDRIVPETRDQSSTLDHLDAATVTDWALQIMWEVDV